MLVLPKYSGEHATGFEALNAESLAFLASCQSLLTEAPVLFAGNHDAQTIKARALAKKRLRKRLERPDTLMGAAKQLIAMLLPEKVLCEQVKWAQQFQKDLNRQDIWARLFLAVPVEQQTEFCRLQQRWQQHATFAAFSHAALVVIAHNIVPAVGSYLALLKAELKHKSQSLFGKREWPDVEAYVASLSDWLNQLKNALATAMAGRLFLASESSDLHVSDVCTITANRLKTLGALKPEFHVLPSRYALTREQFNAFHDFIGNARPGLAVALPSQLAWLKADAMYHSTVIDKKLLIVPKAILPLVPSSQRGRTNAFISAKETLVDYLRRHRYMFAEMRLLNRPVSIQDDKNASEHVKGLATQMENIAVELQTLARLRPTAWWARWFQRGKLNRLNALSNHWQQSASQLLDVALDALTQLVQQWQDEFARSRTLSPTSVHSVLVDAIAAVSQQAETIGVATASQKTHFAQLQQRTFALYAQIKPEMAQMQLYLDEFARGELKSSNRLQPLTHYLEDLRHQADSTELNHFLERARPAVTTLMKTTMVLLRHMGEQVDGLTSEECQSLGRSVHWLLQLGGEEGRKAIKKNLAGLWRAYLSRLTLSSEEPAQDVTRDWFTQCENTLQALLHLLGDSSQADKIKILQQERGTPTVFALLQQKARAWLTDIDTEGWKGRCEKVRDRLIETLWSNLDSTFTTHKGACHRALEQLIQKAVKENKQSIRELALEPHHRTLLELNNPNSPRLRSSDKLVWAMQLAFDGTVDELKQRYTLIEQQQQIFGNSSTSRWGFLTRPCRTENPAADTNTTHTAQPTF